MASNSEATIGAKVANAEKISTHLKSFIKYAPGDDALTEAALSVLVNSTKEKNNESAAALRGYSASVDIRQKLFQKDSNSVKKLLSPIGSAIRSAYGKSSKETADFSGMIAKIRGIKVKKAKKDPDAESVSQSETSYGSITQNFSDIIASLETLGDKYAPANNDITLATLKDKLKIVTESNNAVTASFGALKEKRDDRLELYKQLNAVTQRIKDAVKSQYGFNSTEYNLIKGLKV
jgi:hypothetical protein